MISDFIRNLLYLRQFYLLEKEFRIFGKNFYIQPMKQLAFFQRNLEKKFGKKALNEIYEASKQSFFEICKDWKKFSTNKKTFLDAVLKLIQHFGFGEIEIVEIKEKENRASLQLKANHFAKEYLKLFGKQKSCVDYLLAGILAGFFSEYFEKEVECEEKNCIAKGETFCSFLVH